MPVKPVPEGYHTVTPYLVVPGAAGVIDFLKKAFGAEETTRMAGPDGKVAHAEVKIGDSIVMLGEASEQWQPMPAMLYLYLPDVDAVYQRALDAGGESVKKPENQFYGDRSAMVKDSAGNLWGIATHVEDVPPEEMEKRATEAMKQSA